MKNSTTSTESNPDSTTTENETDLGVEPVTAADLGYDEPAPGSEAPKEATPPAAKPTEPAKPAEAAKPTEPSVTGYGAKPTEPAKPAEATPPAAKPDETPPAEETPEVKIKKEIETEVSTLGDGYNKEKITQFALANKLLPDQVKAYVAQIKADDAAAVKANADRITKQREDWNQELVSDTEFGGENFEKSVFEVDQLVGKYMPNVKKMLTEKKGMLPPSFMKDLLSVAKALKPTNKFEGGEPPAPKEESTSFLDDMYE